jgi:hypothetical protein
VWKATELSAASPTAESADGETMSVLPDYTFQQTLDQV